MKGLMAKDVGIATQQGANSTFKKSSKALFKYRY